MAASHVDLMGYPAMSRRKAMSAGMLGMSFDLARDRSWLGAATGLGASPGGGAGWGVVMSGGFGGDVLMIASVGGREEVREEGWCGGAVVTCSGGAMAAGSGGIKVGAGGGLSGGVMSTLQRLAPLDFLAPCSMGLPPGSLMMRWLVSKCAMQPESQS